MKLVTTFGDDWGILPMNKQDISTISTLVTTYPQFCRYAKDLYRGPPFERFLVAPKDTFHLFLQTITNETSFDVSHISRLCLIESL